MRPGPAGHTVVAPLRNGHPVYLWGTWSKLPALKMQLFLISVLWHGGGKGLFWDQDRSRPHSPRSEQEDWDRARRSLNWCRWRWSSFAAPRLWSGNAGRGGGHHSPQNQLTLPRLSHPKMTSLWLHRCTPHQKVGDGRRRRRVTGPWQERQLW